MSASSAAAPQASTAIHLEQLEAEAGKDVRFVVLEKGSEFEACILSGAVIEPSALGALLPEWRSGEYDEYAEGGVRPVRQEVTSSGMRLLTKRWATRISHPPQMDGRGSFVVSLSRVAAWLGGVAEGLGAEVYPGFAGARLLMSAEP
jgi:electron-transferring-flavoprotein dehydrogenase